MIWDRGDTIAIWAGGEEDRGRAILVRLVVDLCIFHFPILIHSCMHAIFTRGTTITVDGMVGRGVHSSRSG